MKNPFAGVVAVALLAAAAPACAAPSEDPRWEITIGASGEHSDEGWESGMPKAEIKYRWSDRIELESKLSWEVLNQSGGAARSGLGTGEFAIKYRLVDRERAGFALSVFPQVNRSVSRSSVRRGIAPENTEFLLGLEAKVPAGAAELEIKGARNFVEHEPDQWALEIKGTFPCMARADCVVKTERNFKPHEAGPALVALGLDWKLAKDYLLKAAVGREFGPYDPGRTDSAVSIELQMTF
jgi:hypothetical protein